MKTNKIINIINEEISNFDYLGNDKRLKEKDNQDLISNFDFQKQFMIDSIENNSKVKKVIAQDNLSSSFHKSTDNINNETINFDIRNDYEYKYDATKEPAKFNINFRASNVKIFDGKLDTVEDIKKIDWLDIFVNMLDENGKKIDFTAYNKANDNIKKIFIQKAILDNIINDYTYGQ